MTADVASILLCEVVVKSWMLEYYLKRLPTPESLRSSWLFPLFGLSLMRTDHWYPSRHSLAFGISLGWFIGLLPVFGLHMALGLLVGILVRGHLPSIVFGTFISNPFTIPGILALQYLAGRWLCSLAGTDFARGFASLPSVPQFLAAMLMGGVFSALISGILGYAGIRIYLSRRGKNIPGWVA